MMEVPGPRDLARKNLALSLLISTTSTGGEQKDEAGPVNAHVTSPF